MRNARRLSHTPGLASSAFAHHYSRNHCCFLFLRVLRCFTSPRSHQPPYTFRRRRHPITSAGLPHSETPGSKSGCRLPEAYRRLPRPSSAPDAKASTVCPKKLHTHKQHQQRSEPEPTTDKAANPSSKMLASTVQFSNNNQHPPQAPHQERPAAGPTTRRNQPTPTGHVEKPTTSRRENHTTSHETHNQQA
jgi:hypothetical protein